MRTRLDLSGSPDHTGRTAARQLPSWLPVATVALLAIASLLLILWVHREWRDAFRSSVLAVDNLSQSRVYAADATALAEKVLAGDETVQRSDVLASLDRAFLSLEDCRTGASRLAGVPSLHPDDARFLAAVAVFDHALREVRSATETRLSALGPSDRPSVIRQRQALHDLKEAAAGVDLRLSRTLAGKLHSQSRLLGLLTSLWIACALGLTGLVWTNLRQRHASEQQVSNSFELLRTIVECAPVAISVLDRERRVRLWNGFAEQTFGWKREEVYGKRVPFIPPEEIEEADALFEQSLRGEPLAGMEVRRLRKDGSLIELDLYAAPIREAGSHVSGFVIVLADITERKRHEALVRESEARYKQVVENSPFGILILLESRFHYLNPAAMRLFGVSSDADLIGTPLTDRFLPDSRPVIAERLRLLTEEKQPMPVIEEAWLRCDGSPMLVEWSGVPFQHGDRPGALVFFTDVSKVRLVQEEKRKVEAQFFQAQKMESIGRLAGGVAHDFNNLLTVINGYSNLLVGSFEPPDPRQEQVMEVLRAGERAAGLTRQLLAFSRKQAIEPASLYLNDVVREAEKMLRRLIGEDVELVTDLTPDLRSVIADPGQMHQVLLNLAVNARDALPSGGRILIATSNLDLDETNLMQYAGAKPGHYVQLTFTDNGIGMTEDVLQHVFEPFFTTKDQGSGTGLGLSTVYGIVKQSQGSVCVLSEPGHGTTFKMVLPSVSAQLAKPSVSTQPVESVRGSETILVVEDNAEVRRFACQVLRLCGYRILDAPNAAAALKLAGSHPGPIHLLLTDVVMPGATGKELASRLSEVRKETRCLFMSGYTGDVIGRWGVLDPGINYVPKPFTPASLAGKVRMVLDQTPGDAATGQA